MSLIVKDACVRRGKIETLSQLSLHVRSGEKVALIGHNGAGKTTLMKASLGLLPLAAGEIEVDGARPGSAHARNCTAYLPENVSFHPALTGAEVLRMFGTLKKTRENISALLDRVGLGEAGQRRVGTYSKGMRQKLGLAQVLLSKPRLAILDEPTSGLDPIARGDFYGIVDELAAAGSAVLISSHALTELEAKTDRIVILRKGKLVVDDKLEVLRRKADLPMKLRISACTSIHNVLTEKFSALKVSDERFEISCRPTQKMALLSELTSLGESLHDMDIIPPHLDDLYRHYSKEAIL
ncbi:ABC transporter ATP-binding protein [Polycladidibacter hongkongensis]|uniref:ABC transporter ATP-binding protein n=1 Tax=Polycladidibacter hongkongensis TaxID=1647556 RepID=UPI00082985A5|nr:ABC transporter ATP-binding protein [Pseudovibrio hongkongensis]